MSPLAEYHVSEANLVDFCRGSRSIYPATSPHVAPLDSEFEAQLDPGAHPTFAPGDLTYFSVRRNGRVVGRIVATVHRASNELHGQRRAHFGYFECVNDPRAASLLLGAATDFARSHGCVELVGNFNLTAMQGIGVVTDGFDGQPYTDQVYNPPHIPALLEAEGFEATFPMHTFEFDMGVGHVDGLMKEKQRVLLDQSGFTFERINRLWLNRDLEHCRVLLNEAFAPNPMFVPLSREEFAFMAKDMMLVIDPRITVLAYHEGRAVGALVCVPDMNPLLRATGPKLGLWNAVDYLRFRRSRERAVIIYYAIHPDFQNRGLNGLLMRELFFSAQEAGYRNIGGTWIADANPASLRQAEKAGARRLHRLHLYRKTVGG